MARAFCIFSSLKTHLLQISKFIGEHKLFISETQKLQD